MELLKENSRVALAAEFQIGSKNENIGKQLQTTVNNPEALQKFYKQSIQKGGNALLTNTKFALPNLLQQVGLEEKFTQINEKAAQIARQVAEDNAFVIGNIGSAALEIKPFGDFDFEDAVQLYNQQIKLLIKTGIDGILLNGFSEIQNLRAAAIAVRQSNTDLPLMVKADFHDKKMKTGPDPETLSTILNSLDVDAIGANQAGILRKLEKFTNQPLVAGIDEQVSGKDIKRIERRRLGLLVYSGNRSENLAAVAQLSQKKISIGEIELPFAITSYNQTRQAGPGLPFFKIGERINPTGRDDLAKELKAGKLDQIILDAEKQIKAGAEALDVNLGAAMVDETALMEKAIPKIQAKFDIPLVIDSSQPEAIEAGLKNYAGKALVNSVDGDEKKQERILPLVKKYGAAVIGLTIKGGKPGSVEERTQIARQIVDKCQTYGIPRQDIIIDTVAMSAATSSKIAMQSFETVRAVKKELGLPTMMGISNSSFGLPNRNWVHNTFLIQAMAFGLDGGIINVEDSDLDRLIHVASIFSDRDPHCMNYIKYTRSLEK
ncbi:MAG: dihydropteroate synthase [Candidatus Marinimicrobia bacterium]|nr:dihydropteroate synthase [Candidatus Neomarinimicrobiota bacterium]